MSGRLPTARHRDEPALVHDASTMPRRHASTPAARIARRAVALVGAALALALGAPVALGTVAGPPVPVRTPGPAAVVPMLPGPRVPPRWRNPEPWTGAPAAVLVTSLPTNAAGDAASIAWFRSSRTQLALYPGIKNPGSTRYARGPESVPTSGLTNLVATFNSGFYLKDAPGGFFAHGTLYAPMIRGLATVVSYRDGHIDIIRWTGARRPGPDILMARQNLQLLVDNGHIAPGVNVSFAWGVTLGGVPAVWRSAIGIDSNGDLVYVAAPAQTAPSLADVLVHAGAVRAMELDINPEWPILATFGRPEAGAPSLVVPNPNQVATRFLTPNIKDFFAVYLRTTIAPLPAPF
jgi:hypothetical protein